MPNVITPYDPIFYAQEALIQLEKALGMAGRVHRGFSKEPQQRGSTINIRKPGTFTAQDAPSVAQALAPEELSIQLSYWREVKFALTDKELNATQESIIDEHIRPAAYALANDIDLKLAALYVMIPWYVDAQGTTSVADVIEPRKVLFNNGVPMDPERLHFMIDGNLEASLLALQAFSQFQGAGLEGVNVQTNAGLGRKFGVNIFANQNVLSHTKGTCNDTALKITDNPALKGATSISLAAVDAGVAGTLVAGDVLEIAGHTQKYVVTALNTAAGNAFTAVQIYPGLQAQTAQDTLVTAVLDNHVANLMFHRNAFALATAPLIDAPLRELGVRVETVSDPKTNISLRSRVFYDGSASSINVALDVLYGIKCLDPNMAVRLRG